MRGEHHRRDRALQTFDGLHAIEQLLEIVFGSLIAFSAYGFLLRNTRPTVASSYAYVNPVVALAIGSGLGAEPFTAHKLVACGLTVLGVSIALRAQHGAASAPARQPRSWKRRASQEV